ncbi:hypothetical protein GEU84_010175 [Fertoebacter nigrum]|uniref:Uncharacterized protein n=1 Tax=Fertoeibacter niger TaxID=2656921 RepID=A0A8X8KKY5_9RHOB|nr:hypothetical protein [Fertoeibacter niger]NUB44749.1 hypothetical protein [Fertoeibacter niger]
MADPQHKPFEPGLSGPAEAGFGLAEVLGLALGLVWVAAVLAFALGGTVLAGQGLLATLLVLVLPLALIGVALASLRAIRSLRHETARLHAAVEAMRNAIVASQQAQGARPSVEQKLDEIAAAQRNTETVLATFTSRRDPALSVASADRKTVLALPAPPAPGDDQPALALGTPAEDARAPLSVADFIRALHFPESPDDKAGFRALRLALEDRNMAKLIRAAQDVLTLLSQEGIYMDDLKPDRARPEIWRKFAAGERGRGVAALGGVRDRSSLALTAGRMREDPVFRDAAHHFLRTFDRTFAAFEKNASDADLAELADTRTARAFMLFGRVTGTFD